MKNEESVNKVSEILSRTYSDNTRTPVIIHPVMDIIDIEDIIQNKK
ncbi:MAG: hypothetical protein ACRCX2_02990 [Paraclostridium sp.]